MSACKGHQDKTLHYSEETIKGVMIDLYVAAEAIKDLEEGQKDSLRSLYREQISHIHGVNIEVVENDITIMSQDAEWYLDIHTEVKDSLDKIEKQWKKLNISDRRSRHKSASDFKKESKKSFPNKKRVNTGKKNN